jgi:pilus assembly protein CpaE
MTARIISVGAPPTFRQEVARGLGIAPELIEWVPTVAACQESFSGSGDSPEIVVMSPAVRDQDALSLGDSVSRVAPTTAVVVVRDRLPDGFLPLAMRAGIRDVVDLSRGAEELREGLERAMAWSGKVRAAGTESRSGTSEGSGRLHAVFSSKGGTGKSFLAANLASALARQAAGPVAVVDLDVQMGDALSYFGRDPSHTLMDLVPVADQGDPKAVMAAGTKLEGALWGYASPQDPAAHGLSSQAVAKVLWCLRSAFSHTVVDTPAGYSEQVLSVLEVADDILVIAGLDVVAIRHMAVALHTLRSLGVPQERFRLVLNRADSKVGLSPQEVERVMKVHVDAMIPSSRLVPVALNRGEPVVTSEPRSGVAKSVGALASSLLDGASNGNGNGSSARKRRAFRRG